MNYNNVIYPNYRSMEELLKKLIDDKVITKNKVYNTMLQVDRADFLDKNCCYIDRYKFIF